MPDNDTALPEGTDTVIAGASQPVTPTAESDRPAIGGNSEGGLADRLRSGREKLTNEAGGRARGLVTQGLEKSAEALAGVGRMVGDTATGLDDRLGNDYGNYARRAATALDNAANTIASKDPDELIDDARAFVRNSPGVALAGAAVVGFVLARLLKSGIGTTRTDDEDDDDD